MSLLIFQYSLQQEFKRVPVIKCLSYMYHYTWNTLKQFPKLQHFALDCQLCFCVNSCVYLWKCHILSKVHLLDSKTFIFPKTMRIVFHNTCIPLKVHHVNSSSRSTCRCTTTDLKELFNKSIFRLTARGRCTLLELLECGSRGWKPLSNDLTRFYCDKMVEIFATNIE